MNKALTNIINNLKAEGKDYSNFRILLARIKESKEEINKDDILELVTNDSRIQLNTMPNSIAKLISYLANRNNPRNAIDICCGAGNILYYLQNTIDDLTGIEILDNVAFLTSFVIPDLNIISADTFKYPFTRKYDLVVGNIPWGMKVNFNDKLISIEEAFLHKAFELRNDNAEVILLMPYSVLVSSKFQQLRNDYNSYIKEVIAIPPGSIKNYKVKTAILILGNNKVGTVSLSLLTQFGKLTEDYINTEKKIISKLNLFDHWDPEFHLLKDSNFYKELEGFKTVQLNELAEIINGRNIPTDNLLNEGQLLYLKPVHIKNEILIADKNLKYINKNELTDNDYRFIVQPGDIIISTIFNDLKMYIYKAGDIPAFASNNLAIIRSSEHDYILSYLQTEEGKRIFKTQAEDLTKGVTIPHLTLKDLQSIRIPILPISELNILGNKSIERSSKNELQNYLHLLKDFKKESIETVTFHQYSEQSNNNIDISFNFIIDRLNKIESQLKIVNQKLDKLLDLLKQLKLDFAAVRALPRDDEEKLFKLCQKIDNKLNKLFIEEQVTIEGYIEEIKRWLDLWELLDIQSQKFLPIAEFIFDELNRIPEADYAPFVVQYCRAIENEILKKLFEAYHAKGLIDVNIEELVKADLDNQKTGKFASMVKKNKSTYTLGDMNFIMSLLKREGNTLSESLLLQHFRRFTILYFDEQIIEANFLKDIDKLTNDYRNKAAHPYSIGIDMAKQCQLLLRKSLNVFLESLKNR